MVVGTVYTNTLLLKCVHDTISHKLYKLTLLSFSSLYMCGEGQRTGLSIKSTPSVLPVVPTAAHLRKHGQKDDSQSVASQITVIQERLVGCALQAKNGSEQLAKYPNAMQRIANGTPAVTPEAKIALSA